jgi:hypothetical protein
MSDAAIGWIITVFIAVAGFAAKYANDLNIEKKKAEFKLVSDQIERLYGPLNAVTAANEAAWTTLPRSIFQEPAEFPIFRALAALDVGSIHAVESCHDRSHNEQYAFNRRI